MSKAIDRNLFESVFSDADVVDIDLSEWDKRLSLWVLADHWQDWQNRKPLVVVDFEGIIEFSCRFPQSECNLVGESAHLQWNIYDFDISESEVGVRVRLHGMKSSPILTIECSTIRFRQNPIEWLDRINPGWNRPQSGLARPGIAKLLKDHREIN